MQEGPGGVGPRGACVRDYALNPFSWVSMPRQRGHNVSDVRRATRPVSQAERAQMIWFCVGGISVRDLSRSDSPMVTPKGLVVKSRFGTARLT